MKAYQVFVWIEASPQSTDFHTTMIKMCFDSIVPTAFSLHIIQFENDFSLQKKQKVVYQHGEGEQTMQHNVNE